MPCLEMIAVGRVQGVGFRWFVLKHAEITGVKGYVKNLADGNVQIIAQGSSEDLAVFSEFIRQGNCHIDVQHLWINELTQYTEYKDFFIA